MARNLIRNLHPATKTSKFTNALWVTVLVTSLLFRPSTARPVVVPQATDHHMITTAPPLPPPSTTPTSPSPSPSSSSLSSLSLDSWLFPKITVYVINGINGATIKVRCQSSWEWEDIGMRYLGPWQEFNFSFNLKLLNTNRYYCNFYWADKKASPIVYKYILQMKYDTFDFYWKATEEGVVFSNNEQFRIPVLFDEGKWQKA